MKPARQYHPQDSVTVCLLAFWQSDTTHVESCDEQVGTRAPGSEPERQGASRSTLANRVHAATVLGERSNSEQRGRGAYAYGPNGVPQEYARFEGTERRKRTHQ